MTEPIQGMRPWRIMHGAAEIRITMPGETWTDEKQQVHERKPGVAIVTLRDKLTMDATVLKAIIALSKTSEEFAMALDALAVTESD